MASGYLEAALEHAQVIVGGLDRDQLREVIVEPARQAGISVDADLVESLIRDFLPAGMVRSSSAVLPLLSHALLETWRRSRRARMTLDDYRQAGDFAMRSSGPRRRRSEASRTTSSGSRDRCWCGWSTSNRTRR